VIARPVPGDAGDDDIGLAEQACLEKQGALAVEHLFPPVRGDVFGDQHRDDVPGAAGTAAATHLDSARYAAPPAARTRTISSVA
jgi:hypothetical protein